MRFFYGCIGVVFALAVVLYPMLAVTFPSGAPPGFNGAPNEDGNSQDCTACHSSFDLNSGTGSVSIDAPKRFMPGETITFTVSVDNTTDPFPGGLGLRQGFEVSVQTSGVNNGDIGTLVLVDETTTRFADAEGLYVTHSAGGNMVDTWEVQWTAPEGDDAPDAVTIYAAGNAANGGEGFFGDYVYTSTATVEKFVVSNEDEAAPLSARLDAVYPNPFASEATASFALERAGPVTVSLYDGLGRLVQTLTDGPRGVGVHRVQIAAGGLPAGVYFVEVRTAQGRDVRPVTLAR